MFNWRRIALLTVIFSSCCLLSFGQDGATETVEMADTMRQNGKIYVVIAVILTILAGLILYLVRIDRRLTQLEKENK
jgi:MFS superfamily sulfate permease-like transporter